MGVVSGMVFAGWGLAPGVSHTRRALAYQAGSSLPSEQFQTALLVLSPPREPFISAIVLETIIRMWVSHGVEKVETFPCIFEPFTSYIRSYNIVSQKHEDDSVYFLLWGVFCFLFLNYPRMIYSSFYLVCFLLQPHWQTFRFSQYREWW